MEDTSARWAPYVAERQVGAMIEFELIDVDAAKVASAAASVEGVAFTDIAQTHDEITQNSLKIATLEDNLWCLDGSWQLPKKNGINGETGWWSEKVSGVWGSFSNSIWSSDGPLLTFTFSEPQSSDGFTIVFDTKANEVAAAFKIKTYSADGTLINTASVSGNSETIVIVDCPSLNYSKMTVEFTRTAKPYRRVRVTEVVFGYLQQFDKSKIVNMQVDFEGSMAMSNLASGKIAVTIDNSDKAYNVLNPEGVYKFLQDGQGINAAYSINGESVSMGRFYFDNATANDDALTATIVGYDKVYQLDQALCSISGSGSWTVAEAVAAVIADSGVELAIDIPSEIGQRTVGKAIPANSTHREVLRLIAQAGMTHIFINRLDVLTAKDYDISAAVDVLDGTNMTTWGEAKDTGRINTVTVTVSEDVVYTATNKTADEPLKVLAVTNPLATSQEVAEWILEMAGYRYEYSLKSMGNPAGDVGDCIEVANVYESREKAIAIRESYSYNGALRANIKAYGR